ncbi:MAG: phasin family protein [Burkholderiales bacterium]
MLKKAKAAMADDAGATAKGGASKDMAQQVLDSSRHIWLAGLGAFSRAQAEGMKVFETLVRQGEALESKTRRAAVDTAAAARGAAQAKVKEVKQGVGGTWDKLETVFEDRVARALSKLGVHTQNDVERLTARVDRLSEAVNELIKATGVTPAKAAPRKRAAKAPAAARKAAAAKAPAAKAPAAKAPAVKRPRAKKAAKAAPDAA